MLELIHIDTEVKLKILNVQLVFVDEHEESGICLIVEVIAPKSFGLTLCEHGGCWRGRSGRHNGLERHGDNGTRCEDIVEQIYVELEPVFCKPLFKYGGDLGGSGRSVLGNLGLDRIEYGLGMNDVLCGISYQSYSDHHGEVVAIGG